MTDQRLSSWGAQLGALGLDPAAASAPAAKAEALAVRAVSLPPLKLPEAPRLNERKGFSTGWKLGWVVGLTLSISLVMWSRRGPDTLTPKGGAKITVWWEREGKVLELGEHDRLQSGDRVIAEVQAPRVSVAYWLVASQVREPIVDLTFVEASRLDLEPDVPNSFKDSLRLSGENEGETLSILVCSGGPLSRELLANWVGSGGKTEPHGCSSQDMPLRR